MPNHFSQITFVFFGLGLSTVCHGDDKSQLIYKGQYPDGSMHILLNRDSLQNPPVNGAQISLEQYPLSCKILSHDEQGGVDLACFAIMSNEIDPITAVFAQNNAGEGNPTGGGE
jgi:hypothetical protein